jgi:branched-chain amino acid transport system substrate-binding protein
MKPHLSRLLLVSVVAFPVLAFAQAKEQFVPVNSYWVGPYAPGGSGIAAGMIDYFKLLNARDGGINGVKVTWEKCETEYRNDRGVECYERSKKKGPTGATLIHPLSTGIFRSSRSATAGPMRPTAACSRTCSR